MAGPARLSGPGGRATILDVAAAAGVSRQTVTRAMNGMPGISATTRERVLAAAEALQYRPSRFGRGLVTGGERQLGLVVDDLRNPYSPALAAAVVRRAAGLCWNVLLADAGLAGDAGRMLEALGAQADVVVGYLGGRAADWVDRVGPVPVVLLDPADPGDAPSVVLDRSAAVEALADHLRGVGIVSAAVLDPRTGPPSPRGALLESACTRRGIAVRIVPDVAMTAEGAADATTRLLADGPRPDAVLAFNDVMALGALSACRRAGVDVPGDVRVTGFDGLDLGGLVAPTLTTLAVDLDEVAAAALDLAVALADAAPLPTPQRTVQHHLLLRESA
ncbi:LacI family DNA-binding transcriptional regulator [Amnibacterium endophyticum]|uniref:LacI family DNA-binding transcriptional regulator n=1 Tax=Amnibacterium endophyticum TaxID=2109337 RepID=A0ABW4LA96_9MICO